MFGDLIPFAFVRLPILPAVLALLLGPIGGLGLLASNILTISLVLDFLAEPEGVRLLSSEDGVLAFVPPPSGRL